MTKSELKEMIRECLREELAKADYLKESADSSEFVVTYRLKSWPASYKNTELLLDAEDEASAKEAFLDYMFDPDAYDEGDYMPSNEDEIEIISIKASGKLAEGAEDEAELEEGIFGNKYKGMDILTYRGNGKDEPIAIAKTNAGNYHLVHFQNAHAKKNNNDKSDYQVVAATDEAVKRYKKALKSVPDITTNLPQWVQQYIDDSKAQASRNFQNKQQEKEREIQARKDADRKHYQKLGAAKDPDDDYVYIKGNGSGTYKYREELEESLTIDNVFEGLYE